MIMDDGKAMPQEEAVLMHFTFYPDIPWNDEKPAAPLDRTTACSPSWGSNQISPEYYSEASPIHNSDRCIDGNSAVRFHAYFLWRDECLWSVSNSYCTRLCFFFYLCDGTLGTAATTGVLYQPRMRGAGDCREIVGMKIGKGNWSTRRKPAPAQLCPPQIPHD
jgi:hypothetical protein